MQKKKKKSICNINAIAGSFAYHLLRHILFGMRNEVPGFGRTPAFTKKKELGATSRLCKPGRNALPSARSRTGERDAFSSPLQFPAPQAAA